MKTATVISRVLLSALLLAGAAPAQDVTARMDAVVREFADNRQFMGTVLVARGDQIVFDKAYGQANVEWDVPNTTTTKFRLGSVTKQFTAASILLLEERGKLTVDDPVKKYVTDAPPAWDKITLKHLLTHTSGIPNLTSSPDFAKRRVQRVSLEEEIGWFRDQPLDFQPGEKYSYSNSGYIVLGYVIEKASGTKYADFLQANIFTPLAMNDSGYDSSTAIIKKRAAGYTRSPTGFANAPYADMGIPFAAGGLYSTTGDLLRWQRGLYGNKVIKESSLRRMTTAFKDDYAFGLMLGKEGGRSFIQHGGSIEGFNTQLTYYPDGAITVVALSNVNGPAPGQIALKLGALANGDTVKLTSEREAIKVPVEILRSYVGTYALTDTVKAMVTLDGEQLMTQVSGQGRFPAFPESQTQFFMKVVDAQWEFVKEADKVTAVILHQGGRDRTAPRVSDGVATRKEIAVTPATLEQYVGTYALRPNFDIAIRVESGQLVLQATGQGSDTLYAEAADRFFSKVVDATIEFKRDASGKVASLVLHQGAFNGEAPRR